MSDLNIYCSNSVNAEIKGLALPSVSIVHYQMGHRKPVHNSFLTIGNRGKNVSLFTHKIAPIK